MDRAERKALEGRLVRSMRATMASHALIAPGDHVLVAVSGGKDSATLLYLLRQLQRAAAANGQDEFQLTAVHLDQRQPGYDGAPLVRWLESLGVPFEILSEDTYSVVREHLAAEDTACALCSRLRRGILYTAAERLGCNVVALGHHRDDALETFLMNLLYAGRLQAMPAAFVTDDRRFRVIRPLIECAEADIARYAAQRGFPIIPCRLCGSQPGSARDASAELLATLERQIPNVRSIMLAALGNVRPSHLLDREVAEVWARRPPEVRPDHSRPTERHARALPVLSSTGRPRDP